MTGRHAGKSSVVTGAASGIGAATARRLADEGAQVLAVDRDTDRLEDLAGPAIRILAADLASDAGRRRVIDAAGEPDHLVNAAGVLVPQALDAVTPGDWQRQYAVNAEAVFFLMQALGPRMRSGGAIVNLSSVAAKLGTSMETVVYASSKAAVLSLTRSFAFALAPRRVRVNAVLPGIIDTPMQAAVLERMAAERGTTPQAVHEARLRSVWLGRSASAQECAALIAFLLSDEAGYITGQAVDFSGGLVTW